MGLRRWTGLSLWKIVWEYLGRPKESYGTESTDGSPWDVPRSPMGLMGWTGPSLWKIV